MRHYSDYFLWLIGLLGVETNNKPLLDIMVLLFNRTFMGGVPFDVNREADGMELRNEYVALYTGEVGDERDMVSFLELMIALGRRMNDLMYDPTNTINSVYWFWVLFDNLALRDHTGVVVDVKSAGHILDRVNRRDYEHNGRGGFFPLAYPTSDQRTLELWFQMQSYFEELV